MDAPQISETLLKIIKEDMSMYDSPQLASMVDYAGQEAWHLVYKLLWKGDKIWYPSKFIEKCTNNALKILVDRYPQLHYAEDLIDR